MKKFSILVAKVFLLIMLNSCVGNRPASTSDRDTIATIVAETLTALPSATPAPSPTTAFSLVVAFPLFSLGRKERSTPLPHLQSAPLGRFGSLACAHAASSRNLRSTQWGGCFCAATSYP